MLIAENTESPSIVNTERGASVLYHGKHLYSKYNPSATIQRLISKTTIESHCLVLFSSPLLGYGLQALLKKLPETSFILCVEADPVLYNFSKNTLDSSILNNSHVNFIYSANHSVVLQHIETLVQYPFRKIIHLEASGGSALNETFYRNLVASADELIRIFWRNRMTLMHLGQNYARNLFSNLIFRQSNPQTETLIPKGVVKKPIIVVGAGPSLDISRTLLIKNRQKIYIIAVDVALPALMPDIRPDAVVLVESQPWIDTAFIGFKDSNIHLFADCTASPRAVRVLGGRVSFFLTDYAKTHFLDRLKTKNFFNPILEPMGTVSLSALQLALHLADETQIILHTGFDFSWQQGFTHAKGTSHHRRLYANNTKTTTLYPNSVIDNNSFSIAGKNGKTVRTMMNLQSYGEFYRELFAKKPRIFDLDQNGLCYGSKQLSVQKFQHLIDNLSEKTETIIPETRQNQNIKALLHEERQRLLTLKDIFIGKKLIDTNGLTALLEQSDYLYTHFPDAAWGCSISQNFLNRVRIEVEYFLKIFDRL